jgi:2-dehydropantoate 2-reductase
MTMRVLVIGAGVIGSVYAGHLAEAGHAVTVLARGRRLDDLTRSGLRLRLRSGPERRPDVTVTGEVPAGPLDLVMVAVRREQATAAAEQASRAATPTTTMLFGNYAGMVAALAAAAGPGRAIVVGFPGVGGKIDGDTITYSLIRQQPTVVGALPGGPARGPQTIAGVLRGAGFPTHVESDMDCWLASHAALVVPMAAAIRAAGGRAEALARRRDLLRDAVHATRTSYRAQGRRDRLVIGASLRLLYLVMPEWFAVRYWSRALDGEFGELAFAAHTRHAWDEMAALGSWLRATVASDNPEAAAALDRVIELAAAPG